ncbi:MAG: ABC transporter substrate binding protein, partial [Lawsonibacter sp.]
MKKLISICLSTLILTGVLAGCAPSNPSNPAGSGGASGSVSGSGEAPYRIAIVQPMSHTSLDQIRDTIVEQLNASGKNIEITLENANNDSTALSTILSNCKAKGVDMVIPIGLLKAGEYQAV